MIVEADNIVKSFDTLSEYDKKLAQPSRIKIIKVSPNDTVDSLSKQIAVPKNKKEIFCVINGLDCSSEDPLLIDSQLVKIITDTY